MSRVRRLAPRPGAALFTRLLGALLSTVALSLGVISLLFVLGLVAPDRAAASEADESGESVRGQRGGRVVHDANQDVGDGSCSAADAEELIAWFSDDIELLHVYVSAEATTGDPVEELAELLEERYEVAFADDVLDVNPRDDERLVIIDDALAVTGQAALFASGDGAATLYLHSASAAADARTAMTSGCALSTAPSDEAPTSQDTANQAPAEPDAAQPEAVEPEPAPVEPEPAPPEALASVAASPIPPASQGAGVAASWQLADGEAEVLTGYADDVSFDLRLPAGWEVASDAKFIAEVVASEIGRDDLSLRVDVDGRPAHTWSPGDRSTIELDIEPTTFAEAGFEIRAFTTTPLVSDLSCPDVGHVGRWVDIGTPVVHANVRPHELDVARAIAGLGPISQLTNEPITIIVDASGSPALLETAGALAAAVGHHGAPVAWNVVSDVAANEVAGTGSVIVIDERPGEPARVSVSVDGDRAILSLAGDGEGLVGLANSMAQPDRLVYFHDAEISGNAIPPVATAGSQEVFGFADAGYDDRTLRGAGEKSLIYRLHIPAGVPPDRATLALYGTYAPVLAERGATVSVRINGSEEEIIAVADETGRLEVLHTLTAASLRPGLNFVKVTVDLGDAGARECSSGPRGWLTVSEASGLAVEAADNPEPPELGVEDARFALASTVDFTAADVVIRNADSAEDVRQALVVIAELADRADGGAPRLVSDADASTDRHLVVLGPVGDRELLSDVVPVELGDSVGLVAALPSPYTRGRVLLAMTGGTEAATALAVDAALSARVNDLTVSHALVGVDRVQPIGGEDLAADRPEQLAFEEREPGPPVDDYEAWLLAQAARIESAAAPQAEVRRLVAFGLLLSAAVLFGFGWIRRIRQSNTAGSGGGH